ncbi:GNAT family N-acetyltransferase [Acetivibrio mesophilus]|uniref:N-acetyltransferase n=1 Tax=Acetivibrio mesophilus TaxID=2487273 RepID=A0A4Q0I872_9FIRM|nr:GNAT family N-acetyltransferase [Acetivibrio mesophilus]ODM26357.1 GCN5 family acetyltransferase [Clostridium sp. Bc-iso-3]RXE60583.1 N-acetyltransferase [Acetivibrio mesophilus]HHV30349.1 GNAT family N-acetyltransferase [Clostridium sp.]
MVIETDRLILREMTEKDFDALYTVLADSDIMEHYSYSFDEDRIRGWIRKNIERYKVFGFGLWAVVLKETGEMIGDCGLTMQIINGQIKPEIGYHIRKDCQRRGYASEAAKAVRDWTFINTPINIIYSYMKHTNVASYRTAIAYGCQLVDEFEDDGNENTKVYAISRDEWKKLKKYGGYYD